MDNVKKKNKYLIILLLTAGLNIWNIVYLPSYFYVPFQNAFSLTNEQQGTLLSMYGIMAVIGYFLGGMVADKFKPKTLMVVSSIATSALGFFISTMPSYNVLLFVYLLFGVTAVLLYWSAFVKSLRLMGDNDEQGKIFGAFESNYGLVSLILSYIVLLALSSYIEQQGHFEYVIYCYSGFSLVIGIIIQLFYKPEDYIVNTNIDEDRDKFKFSMVKDALKLPVTWFNTIIVFAMFVLISGALYINPFVNSVYLVPVTWATALGILIKYGFRIFCSPLGGRLVDKVGRSSKVLMKTGVFIAIALIALLLIPKDPSYIVLGLVVAFLFCFGFNLPRSCMYVPVAEANVPAKYLGTVVGIVSAIGYSSDIYIWKIFGAVLDKHGKAGYNYLFAIMLAMTIVLIITGYFYDKYLDKIKIQNEKEASETC